jgi:hypothetical protein
MERSTRAAPTVGRDHDTAGYHSLHSAISEVLQGLLYNQFFEIPHVSKLPLRSQIEKILDWRDPFWFAFFLAEFLYRFHFCRMLSEHGQRLNQ